MDPISIALLTSLIGTGGQALSSLFGRQEEAGQFGQQPALSPEQQELFSQMFSGIDGEQASEVIWIGQTGQSTRAACFDLRGSPRGLKPAARVKVTDSLTLLGASNGPCQTDHGPVDSLGPSLTVPSTGCSHTFDLEVSKGLFAQLIGVTAGGLPNSPGTDARGSSTGSKKK